MYPVVSVLRRTAAHYVYVTPEMLEIADGQLHVRLETSTSYLDMEKAQWREPTDLVPVVELVATEASSIAAAISQTEAENLVAELARAKDAIYTLIFGPEEEEFTGVEKVRRKTRIAAVRGVYRASKGKLKSQAAKDPLKAQFGKKPKGTVSLS